jgi:hypothetical protein
MEHVGVRQMKNGGGDEIGPVSGRSKIGVMGKGTGDSQDDG